MATGTVVVLDDPVVTVGGQTVSDQIKSLTIALSANMNDASSFDSGGWEESRPGLRTSGATIECYNSEGTNEITTLVWTAWSTGASLAFTGKADGASTGAGNPDYQFTTYVESFDPISGSVGDNNETSISLKGSGAVTRDVTP